MPDIAVRTRSVTVLKSLVAECSFLSWMPEPMYDSESKAGIMGTLPIPGVRAARTLTAFQRRDGILPRPAARLLDELRSLTEGGMALRTTR
jgi:DNA-binding transcriptional LysR family regulator